MISLGVNPTFVDDKSGFSHGTIGVTDDGNQYVYYRAGHDISASHMCELDMATGDAYLLDDDRVSGQSGNKLGVAHETIPGRLPWVVPGVGTRQRCLRRGDD